MNKTIPLLVSVLLLILNPVFTPSAAHGATYAPGVQPGQFVDLAQFSQTSNGTLPRSVNFLANFSSIKNQVQSVNGNNVSALVTFTFTNGTAPRNAVYSGNVQNGKGNLTFLIISGGLSAGDPVYQSTVPGQAFLGGINYTVTRAYAGSLRSVNVLNQTLSFGAFSLKLVLYWDTTTGFLLELSESGVVPSPNSSSVIKFSIDAKTSSTNVWSSSTQPNFGLDASPLVQTKIGPGGTVSFELNLTSFQGFSGTVFLAASLAASNYTVASPPALSLKPTSVTLSSGSSAADILTISSGPSSTVGLYIIVVTGSTGLISNSALLTVRIASIAPDFSLSASPPPMLNVGQSESSTLTVGGLNGFTSTVVLSDTPLPSGLSCNPISPSSITGSGTATLSCTSTSAKTYQVTITGTSGTLIHSATATFKFGVVAQSMIYVTNKNSNTTSVIDGVTNAVVTTVKVGGFPLGVAFDPSNNDLYVTSKASHSVSVISAITNTVVATVNVGNGPIGVAYDSSNNDIYVANAADGTLSVINGSTNSVVATVNVGLTPYLVTYDSSNNDIYVANAADGTVSVISGSTNTLVATVHVGNGTNPSIAFDSSNNDIYVSNSKSGSVSVIDGSTNTVVANITVGNPGSIAFDSSNGDLYVASSGGISIINGSTNTVVMTLTLPAGGFAGDGAAFDPFNDDLYFSSSSLNTVFVIDGSTDTVVATVGVGNGPASIAVAHVQSGGFTSLDYPGASMGNGFTGNALGTAANGINNEGTIVGVYRSASSPCETDFHSNTFCGQGFLLSGSPGSFVYKSIDATEPVSRLSGINDNGLVVGNYAQYFYGISNGFLYNTTSGKIMQIPATSGACNGGTTNGVLQSSTSAEDISNNGTIVGEYENCYGSLGFGTVYAFALKGFPGPSPTFTILNTMSGGNFVSANSINDQGVIAGSVHCSFNSDCVQGYILYPNGTINYIDFPASRSPTGFVLQTWAFSINDLGQIVGYYSDGQPGAGRTHGFLYSNGVYTSFDVPSSNETVAYGVNNAGQIVGYYWDSAGDSHGFLVSETNLSSFNYSLSNSGPVVIQSGSSGSVTIKATLTSGTPRPITLSCVTPLPSGISCTSFNPASVTPAPGAVSSLTINVASTVAPGSYNVQVTGSPLGATTTPATVEVIVPVASIPVGTFPTQSAVDPSTNRIYVTNYIDATVSVIDGSTNSVLATVPVASNPLNVPGTGPQGVAVNPVTHMIYVGSTGRGCCVLYYGGYADNTVTVINGTTDSVVTTVSVGYFPNYLAVNPVTNRVYVSAQFSGTVSVIDGSTNKVISTISTGVGSQGIAVDPATKRAYVAMSGAHGGAADEVLVIDLSTNRIISTIGVGSQPIGLAVNPSTNLIYVANCATCISSPSGPGTVSVIDGSTNSVVATIAMPPVNLYPYGLGVDTATNRIYVTGVNATQSPSLQGVSVIDGSKNAVVDSFSLGITGGGGGQVIGVDPLTQLVYITHIGPPSSYSGSVFVVKDLAPLLFDYSLSLNPTSTSIVAGSSASATVTATLVAGSAQPITLGVSSISPNPTVCQTSSTTSPCGAIMFDPARITPSSTGATSALTISTTSVLPPGTYTLTITGSPAGTSSSSAVFTVTVTPSPTKASTSVSVSCSPSSINVGRFTTCAATVTGANPSGSVTFTTSSSTGTFATAACTLSAGTCSVTYADTATSSLTATITASYQGDSNNEPSQGTFSLSISKPTGVIAVGTSSLTLNNGGVVANQASATGISVTITGATSANGTPVGVTTETLSSPNSGIPAPNLASPSYYDVLVTGISSGNARVCISFSSAASSTTMQYWNGVSWTSASSITVSGGTVCGTIPVSALSGTNVVLGGTVQPSPSKPSIFGLDPTTFYIIVAAIIVIILAITVLGVRSRKTSIARQH